MSKIFVIAIGGSIGAILRYSVSHFINLNIQINNLPIGTIFVNATGCFIAGLVIGGFSYKLSGDLRSFLIIGMLGSYTTFSSFGIETISLVQDDKLKIAILNVASTFILTLLGVTIGYVFSKKIIN
ncbi:MAG: CrcB protein [Chloroflexi bacterium]|jgi:CrcB protein|nr:MAG: CrcB protein [Chloroflexota bacterium]|tara:strand:+ start:6330 stop:6707 length:378 start_codon:yes stop_codon:yes gene_type:complete